MHNYARIDTIYVKRRNNFINKCLMQRAFVDYLLVIDFIDLKPMSQ